MIYTSALLQYFSSTAKETTSKQADNFPKFILTTRVEEPRALKRLLQLLLGPQVVGVTTLLLAAVDRAGVEPGVAPGTQRGGSQVRLLYLTVTQNHL